MFAQASALLAAITFLPRHGTSTRFGNGIADHAQHALKRHGCGRDGLRQRALRQRDQRGGGHACGRTALGLAAADLGGEGPCVAMKTPIRPLASIAFAISSSPSSMSSPPCADHGARQAGARAGRGRGDDDAHRAFHFHQRGDVEDDAVRERRRRAAGRSACRFASCRTGGRARDRRIACRQCPAGWTRRRMRTMSTILSITSASVRSPVRFRTRTASSQRARSQARCPGAASPRR